MLTSERPLTSARYKRIPAKGIYLPNADHLGFNKYMVHAGDVIVYRERYEGGTECRRVARVLDLVTHSHEGKEFRAPSVGSRTKAAPKLRVLAFDDLISHGFERWIDVADVLVCRKPTVPTFAAWALTGPLPDPEVILAASRYGTLCDTYFADACDESGNLDADWLKRSNAAHDRRLSEARARAESVNKPE